MKCKNWGGPCFLESESPQSVCFSLAEWYQMQVHINVSSKQFSMLNMKIQVWCCYSVVDFLQNADKRRPIAHPWGWDMGCLLWVQCLDLFCAAVNAMLFVTSWYIKTRYNNTRLYRCITSVIPDGPRPADEDVMGIRRQMLAYVKQLILKGQGIHDDELQSLLNFMTTVHEVGWGDPPWGGGSISDKISYRKILERPWDLVLKLSYHSEIWQMDLQQGCNEAQQIAECSGNTKHWSLFFFNTSRVGRKNESQNLYT